MKNIENRGIEWYRERIEYLAEFMTPDRRTKLEQTVATRTRYMTILAENTFHSQNSSALMRHCEAFGVQELHAVESICEWRTYSDIVRGTDKWVDLQRYENTEKGIETLKANGYRIVATTPHREDCTPESFNVEGGKFALIFGTEHSGISEEIIAQADEFMRIPMCGMVESLNVSASAAILIYMLSERLRHSSASWQLSEMEQAEILYRWMRESIKDAQGVMGRKYGEDQ